MQSHPKAGAISAKDQSGLIDLTVTSRNRHMMSPVSHGLIGPGTGTGGGTSGLKFLVFM